MNASSTFARNLWLRLVAALLVAMVGVLVLHHTVVAREQPPLPSRSTVRPVAAPTAAASPLAALGFPLLPVAGTVLLASRVEAIPPEVAPVLQVLRDGSLAVRRPPRVATGPTGETTATKGDRGAVALVVPRTPIAHWTVAARGAAVEVLGCWLTERPVPASRLRDVDLGLGAHEVATLLSWLP